MLSIGLSRGGLGCSTLPLPLPDEIPKFWQSRTALQIERKKIKFSYSNILISLKITEFGMPVPQVVREKGSKILKLARFAIVLHLQWQINWLSS